MLIRFSVTNYKAFRDTATLSMEATKDRKLSENTFQTDSYKGRLLKLSATYGANASGKTTLFQAMKLYINFIKMSASHLENAPLNYVPFAFEGKNTSPTSFEADFVIDGMRYVYGFSYNEKRITEEHLFSYPKGKKKEIVVRTGNSFHFTNDVKFRTENARRVRENTLYVSVCSQFNDIDCMKVVKWASERVLPIVGINATSSLEILTNLLSRDARFRKLAYRAFKIADLGICEVRDRNMNLPLGTDAYGTMLKPIQDIWVKHDYGGRKAEIPISQESSGTIRFLTVIGPVIDALRSGSTLVFDEMDLSFHTDLCLWIAGLFLDPGENRKNAQLILNTHDMALLDQSLVRRDQINITSKDWKTGAAEIRRVSDYGIRNDLDIRKAYLNGSFGGKPFIAPEKLMEEE